MKLRDWHDREVSRNAEYAQASAEIALAQTLADIVVAGRIRAGLTQVELAKRAGTTQARISHIENGEGNPKLDTIAGVLSALGKFVEIDLSPLNLLSGGPVVVADVLTSESVAISITTAGLVLDSTDFAMVNLTGVDWMPADSNEIPVDLQLAAKAA